MNILPINNNQHKYQPKFKALKIDSKVASQLEKKSPDFINKLNTIGESLAEIKRFHVVLKDPLKLKPEIYADDVIKHGNRDYFYELKHEIEPNLGKAYYVTSGDETFSGFNPTIPRIFEKIYGDNQETKYLEFKTLDEYEQATEYSKLLDKSIAMDEEKALKEKLAEEKRIEEERLKKEQHRSAIANLIDKYKLESPKQVEKPKKKWWPF